MNFVKVNDRKISNLGNPRLPKSIEKNIEKR